MLVAPKGGAVMVMLVVAANELVQIAIPARIASSRQCIPIVTVRVSSRRQLFRHQRTVRGKPAFSRGRGRPAAVPLLGLRVAGECIDDEESEDRGERRCGAGVGEAVANPGYRQPLPADDPAGTRTPEVWGGDVVALGDEAAVLEASEDTVDDHVAGPGAPVGDLVGDDVAGTVVGLL